MGAIEDALRVTFAERVGLPPAVEDVADRAIGRAGRHRRRQVVLGALAIVVVVLTGGGALMYANAGGPLNGADVAGTATVTPQDGPAPISPSGRTPVDVLVGDSIVTAAGQIVPLTQVVRADPGSGLRRVPVAAYRAEKSWLVRVTEPAGGEALYRVWPNGSVAYVLKGQSIMVAPDGVRVAWLDGHRMFAAQLDGDGWVGQASIEVPAGTRPVGFGYRTVLLGHATGATDVGAGGYEAWLPMSGEQAAEDPPAMVYGPTPTRAVLGLTAAGPAAGPGDGKLRFAEFSVDKLAVQRIGAVVSEPDLAATGTVSPDGRWLLVLGRGTVALYDLTDAFRLPEIVPAVSWTMDVTSVAWYDSASFVVGGPNVASVLRTDGGTISETHFGSDRKLTTMIIAPQA